MLTYILKLGVVGLILKFFLGIVLSMIAKILGFLLEIPNLVCAIILHLRNKSFLKVINEYQFQSALENDIFLHYNFRALWTICLSNGKGYTFGTNKDETVSSAIGRKFLEKTLSWIGLALYYILYAIDYSTWKNEGHCISAFRSYESNKK